MKKPILPPDLILPCKCNDKCKRTCPCHVKGIFCIGYCSCGDFQKCKNPVVDDECEDHLKLYCIAKIQFLFLFSSYPSTILHTSLYARLDPLMFLFVSDGLLMDKEVRDFTDVVQFRVTRWMKVTSLYLVKARGMYCYPYIFLNTAQGL